MPTPVFQLAFGEKQSFPNLNGAPLAGYKLYIYDAGTQNKVNTYQETDGVALNTNPIVLNADGTFPYGIYVVSGLYKVALTIPTEPDPPSNFVWTRDNLTPVNDVGLTLNEWEAAGGTPTWVNATTFTLSGNQTAEITPGRRMRITDSGGIKTGMVVTATFGAGVTTVVMNMDGGASLVNPITTVEQSFLSSDPSALPVLSSTQFSIRDIADASKLGGFDVSGVSAGQRRVGTFPNYNFRMGNIPAGIGPIAYSGRTVPTGWLNCNQAAVSRTTYADLFAAIVPVVGTFTVTIASPAVFTLNTHGFSAGDAVYFTTTGALPTGLSVNTIYYVLSAGLTANDFRVSLQPGGTVINTSGTQSGVHTCRFCPYGLGDGSTTFDLPKVVNRMIIPAGTGTVVEAFTASSANGFVCGENVDKWITGMAVTVSNLTGFGGTIAASNYFVSRQSSTNIRLASTLALAQNNTPDITITGSGTATLTATMDVRVAGQQGGWDYHAQSITELLSHSHSTGLVFAGGSPVNSAAGSGGPTPVNTTATGGNVTMPVKNPYVVVPMFIISY